MDEAPVSGGAAADRVADALGTPDPIAYGAKANVTAFTVRRFVDRGLLANLSGNPEGTLHHPGQVAEVCRREGLADLVTVDPLEEGPSAALDGVFARERAAVEVLPLARVEGAALEGGGHFRVGLPARVGLLTLCRNSAVTGADPGKTDPHGTEGGRSASWFLR
ncbi:hypothetical protein [Streptomyces sp. NPDC059247]|uniref:hypothetical protein n=1 Tax=Streptomyces sp. NPDC059247 TaxID=3346790 RepID=UPI00368A1377